MLVVWSMGTGAAAYACSMAGHTASSGIKKSSCGKGESKWQDVQNQNTHLPLSCSLASYVARNSKVYNKKMCMSVSNQPLHDIVFQWFPHPSRGWLI